MDLCKSSAIMSSALQSYSLETACYQVTAQRTDYSSSGRALAISDGLVIEMGGLVSTFYLTVIHKFEKKVFRILYCLFYSIQVCIINSEKFLLLLSASSNFFSFAAVIPILV